jgi:hypothetical protein
MKITQADREAALAELAGMKATGTTARIVADAFAAELRPHLAKEHRARTRGLYRVWVGAQGPEGLFGAIDVSVTSGKITRAYLTHGNHGTERVYTRVAEIRTVIRSWAAARAAEASLDALLTGKPYPQAGS